MRAHDLLHTRHVRFHTTVLLCIVGELDIATAPLLHHAAQTCLIEPTDTVCLDLTGLTFCDATGLHALQQLADTFRRAQVTCHLTGISPQLKRTLTQRPTPPAWTPPARLR
ncbi:STAS domain-containing protein [Streptomyces sp900105245]|uniref:STAS domain-containing protein n=1 Tax=Streptomyces sp. 900105245 TaxID=3154379 RepID=A0ABV1UL61_9ACTN